MIEVMVGRVKVGVRIKVTVEVDVEAIVGVSVRARLGSVSGPGLDSGPE